MVRHRRQAFTLIELLVVIGIILLLIGIAVLGFQHVEKVGAEKSTKALRFESCNSILSEYEASVGNLNAIEGPTGIYTSSGLPSSTSAIGPVGDVNVSAATRYKDPAVLNTGNILQAMSHVPSAKTIIAQMPAAALLTSNNIVNGMPLAWLDTSNSGAPVPIPGTLFTRYS